MHENGSQETSSELQEEPRPGWASHSKGEGPIETAGTLPTPKDLNAIPPASGEAGKDGAAEAIEEPSETGGDGAEVNLA